VALPTAIPAKATVITVNSTTSATALMVEGNAG
jgi:hypothetical protein